SCVRQEPTASKFSSARPIGSKILWQEAQGGLGWCSSILSRVVGAFALPVESTALSLIAGTFGGGSGGLTPRNVCRYHLPRATGEVRAAFEVRASNAPLPSKPRRTSRSAGKVTRRNCGP